MALVLCKECTAQISSDVKACPHCGKKKGGWTAGAKLGAVMMLGMFAWCTVWASNDKTAPPTNATPSATSSPRPLVEKGTYWAGDDAVAFGAGGNRPLLWECREVEMTFESEDKRAATKQSMDTLFGGDPYLKSDTTCRAFRPGETPIARCHLEKKMDGELKGTLTMDTDVYVNRLVTSDYRAACRKAKGKWISLASP
jgi:hypothetical protein